MKYQTIFISSGMCGVPLEVLNCFRYPPLKSYQNQILYWKYIQVSNDVGFWSTWFCILFLLSLSWNCPLTEEPNIINIFWEIYDRHLKSAKSAYSQVPYWYAQQ